LFAVDNVTITDLSEKLELGKNELLAHLQELDDFLLAHTPLTVRYAGDQVRLFTRPEYAEYIRKFREEKPQRLSQEALETLAIIIYKQPCTRQEIEDLRGVDSEKTISTLIRSGLIRAMGNIKQPGSPVMYSITDECLFAFGVRSYEELIDIIKETEL
ncbi:MAG: SMC-Scp complex subunit ScpB, partial [Nitrospirae bacterium]